MDNDKVDEALYACWWIVAKVYPQVGAQRCEDLVRPKKRILRLQHVRWMTEKALTWSAERLEKKFRWLGFIQGVLWSEGIQSIEESKRQNMPADGTFSTEPRDISEEGL